MERPHKKLIEERVSYIIDLFVIGAKPSEILQNPSVKAWGVSDRTLWTYIGKAYKYFETKANVNRDEELGQILDQYRFLYLQMLRAKDYRGAGTILDKRAELIGLKIVKTDVSGQVNHKVTFAAKDDIEKL